MPKMQCGSCGGVYESTTADGLLYFHACPPVPIAVTVKRAGAELEVLPGDVQKTDEQVRVRFAERADRRDENVQVAGFDKKGQPIVQVKIEGKGAAPVP